jgi:hypothetical protein
MPEEKIFDIKLSLSGIVSNMNRNNGRIIKYDRFILNTILGLYKNTKREYLKGNKDIVNKFFEMVI